MRTKYIAKVGSARRNFFTTIDFTDREDTITGMPAALIGGRLVRTPDAWRFDDSAGRMSLTANRGATVNVLIDTLAGGWPAFVADDPLFKSTGELVTTNRNCYTIVRRAIDGNVSLKASGMRSGFGSGNRAGYAFIVQPDTVRPSVQGRYVSTDLDTGALPYVDSLWYIRKVHIPKNGLLLFRNRQAEFADASDSQYVLTIDRAMPVYCAVDGSQTIPPKFISDTVGGEWELTGYSIETSAADGVYTVYRKFYRNPGTYAFAGARSDGATDNRYNFFLMADTSVITDSIGNIPPGQVTRVDSLPPWEDVPDVRIDTAQPVFGIIRNFVLIRDSLMSEECRHLQFSVSQQVRVRLGVDPAFNPAGTFLVRDGWTKTGYTIALTGGDLADRIVWQKEFMPGDIDIPGPQCDRPQPGVLNPLVILEFLEAPYRGLYARELAVRGFGDERGTASENYVLNNLDIVYSWNIGLRSRNYIADIVTTNAKTPVDDTLRVLSPFETDVIYSTGDTVVTRVKDRFALADLMPVLVAADSVEVNAIDLTAMGSVRIAFRNNSAIAVNREFTVLLYEDRNHDFKWTQGVDHAFGQIVKRGIAANEYKVYRIGLNDTIKFPHQTFFAFIDSKDEVRELSEWNNIASGGGACDGVVPETWIEPIDSEGNTQLWGNADSLYAGLPETADSVLFCYLKDTDGDGMVTYNDSLAILYVYNYRMHAVNAVTHDSLFPSSSVSSVDGFNLRLGDYNGDGGPEIVAGSRIFTATGALIADFAPDTCDAAPVLPSSFDFNNDADPDSVGFDEVDSCITVRSGRDSTLLFACPLARYTGESGPETEGMLAAIHAGDRHCYNVNLSFPRLSVVAPDTADLTVRVSCSGNDRIGSGVSLALFADTVTGRTLPSGGTASAEPADVMSLGVVQVKAIDPDRYEDVVVTVTLPPATKRVWFRVDGENRYFESYEDDNVIVFGVE